MASYDLPMVQLRPMRLPDVELIVRWDEDPVVRAAIGGAGADWYDWPVELAREVSWRELLIAEADGRPIGFVQLTDAANEENGYWSRPPEGSWAIDIWLGHETDRGRGLGSQVMAAAVERTFDRHGATSILIDPLRSNQRAIAFYRRLGFIEVSDESYLDDDDCLVMERRRSEPTQRTR